MSELLSGFMYGVGMIATAIVGLLCIGIKAVLGLF